MEFDQKERFIGVYKGTKSRDDVLNGAEQAGYTDGTLFLNYE